jgi:hypothetical protein
LELFGSSTKVLYQSIFYYASKVPKASYFRKKIILFSSQLERFKGVVPAALQSSSVITDDITMTGEYVGVSHPMVRQEASEMGVAAMISH